MKKYLKLFVFFVVVSSLLFFGATYSILTDVTNPVVNSFTISDSSSHTITFVPNNGDSNTTTNVYNNQPIGSFPTLSEYNDCALSTGDYDSRNCTYAYELVGWYLEPTFVTKIDSSYVPTGNTTIYAKWTKVYYRNDGPVVFSGNSLLDTGIQLFNEDNADKDFIVTLTVDSFGTNQDRAVMFANMSETGDPYQGVQFRYFNNRYNVNANAAIGNKKNTAVNYTVGDQVVLKREGGKFYYSMDGGTTFTQYQNYTNFNLYFNVNATFGGEYDAHGNPYRYFNGTLSGMKVELITPDTYTIKYNANGGTGTMNNQTAYVNATVNLDPCLFTRNGYRFASWNTVPDGSGTTYTHQQAVTSLGNKGDIVNLYAIWTPAQYYYIHFDANGGTGSMPDQQIIYDDVLPNTLNAYNFTRSGYKYRYWTTAADGTGTKYTDMQEITSNLASPNQTLTLYAQYLKYEYQYNGTYTFNGTSDYIDTGVNVYSSTTYNKDFEIGFTVNSVHADNATLGQEQPTILSVKDESNSYWPGFVTRLNNNSAANVRILYKWSGVVGTSTTIATIQSNKAPITFVFKRTGGVVTVRYTYGNYDSGELTVYNEASWALNQYFSDNITFGSNYDATHNPDRFFKGTLSNMYIAVQE